MLCGVSRVRILPAKITLLMSAAKTNNKQVENTMSRYCAGMAAVVSASSRYGGRSGKPKQGYPGIEQVHEKTGKKTGYHIAPASNRSSISTSPGLGYFFKKNIVHAQQNQKHTAGNANHFFKTHGLLEQL